MDFSKVGISQDPTEECQIWIFAKSHAIEIKRQLQNLLGFQYNIMAVLNAANDLAEALYSKKEMLKHLASKDYVVIVGGINGNHLDDHQYILNDFCNSIDTINILLCDEKFNNNLKMLEQRSRRVKCLIYHKYSPAQDIIDFICRLLQKEIQKGLKKVDDNNIDSFPQACASTSSTRFNPDQNATNAGAGDTFSKGKNIVSDRNSAFNAYGDVKAPSPSKPNNLKRFNENPPKNRTKSKPNYRPRSVLYVAHQNINGLMAKEGKLNNKINELSRNNIDLDVICLTEHNMVDEDVDVVNIPNFELAHTIIRDERQGGCTILIRDDFKVRVLPKVEINNHPEFLECCAVKLVDLDIIIICVYRPPRYYRQDIEEFLDELDVILRRYKKQKVIICGDFNIDILNNDKSSRDFQEVISNYKMTIAIKTPTKVSGKTCIDNIIHNMPNATSLVMNWNLSDHIAQILKCPLT